jgi:hypothetical protein
VRELWPVGVTIQHRINTRKQVAYAPCSLRSNHEQMYVLGHDVTTSRTHRKCIVSPRRIPFGRSQGEILRAGNLPRAAALDSVKVFSCGGTGLGEQRRVGGPYKRPVSKPVLARRMAEGLETWAEPRAENGEACPCPCNNLSHTAKSDANRRSPCNPAEYCNHRTTTKRGRSSMSSHPCLHIPK